MGAAEAVVEGLSVLIGGTSAVVVEVLEAAGLAAFALEISFIVAVTHGLAGSFSYAKISTISTALYHKLHRPLSATTPTALSTLSSDKSSEMGVLGSSFFINKISGFPSLIPAILRPSIFIFLITSNITLNKSLSFVFIPAVNQFRILANTRRFSSFEILPHQLDTDGGAGRGTGKGAYILRVVSLALLRRERRRNIFRGEEDSASDMRS